MLCVKTMRPFTEKIISAWAKGCNGDIIPPIKDYQGMRKSTYAFLGILRGSGDMLKRCIAKGYDYYFIDHAYFLGGHDRNPAWYRATKNGHVAHILKDRPSDRYEKYFKQDIKPYRSGSKIIVCPPTGAIEWMFDTQDWLNTTVGALKQHTDREIVVRDKPMNPQVKKENGVTTIDGFIKTQDDKPLQQDLDDAHCVVTFNSGVGVKALCEGIPVICGTECAAYPIANKIEDIENLQQHERQPWLNHLAYSQFTLAEMESGYALEQCT
jgi:hypothetical protein